MELGDWAREKLSGRVQLGTRPNGERSESLVSNTGLASLCCVLGQDTLISLCLTPPRCVSMVLVNSILVGNPAPTETGLMSHWAREEAAWPSG